jgi:hypothetical protein
MWVRMDFGDRTHEGKKRARKRLACPHDQVTEEMAFGVKTILSCRKCDAMWEEIS